MLSNAYMNNTVMTPIAEQFMLQFMLVSVTVCRPAVVASACRANVQTVSAKHESEVAIHEGPYTTASTPDLAAQSKSTTLARAVPVMKASLSHSYWWWIALLRTDADAKGAVQSHSACHAQRNGWPMGLGKMRKGSSSSAGRRAHRQLHQPRPGF